MTKERAKVKICSLAAQLRVAKERN